MWQGFLGTSLGAGTAIGSGTLGSMMNYGLGGALLGGVLGGKKGALMGLGLGAGASYLGGFGGISNSLGFGGSEAMQPMNSGAFVDGVSYGAESGLASSQISANIANTGNIGVHAGTGAGAGLFGGSMNNMSFAQYAGLKGAEAGVGYFLSQKPQQELLKSQEARAQKQQLMYEEDYERQKKAADAWGNLGN